MIRDMNIHGPLYCGTLDELFFRFLITQITQVSVSFMEIFPVDSPILFSFLN